MWTFDQTRTQARHKTLQAYYETYGLNPEHFACRYCPECDESQGSDTQKQYTGSTAGLSPFYDAAFEKHPIRVLIIGKEIAYNSSSWPIYGVASNFDARSRECIKTIYSKNRTNHIKGTLETLQNIFGTESDYIYASYALSNALRCGYQIPEKFENVSELIVTPTMRKRCYPYLMDEIEILQPTLIISQGSWAIDSRHSLVHHLTQAFGATTPVMHNANGKYGLYKFADFMYLSTHHPARLGMWRKNYAPDSLWPMLDHLRELGHLPTIPPDAGRLYESLVAPTIDSLLAGF